MAATFSQRLFSISELARLESLGELIIQPKFQRRSFWTPDARSYLIDTIVRSLPMPKIYLRRQVLEIDRPPVYEVVDGQQRLQSIFDFIRDRFELKQKHNRNFPNLRYKDLPDPVKRTFLSYQISVELMEHATDPEVWGMFERLNRYTFTVNAQERRNAEFSGLFKQSSYRLAAEQLSLDTWQGMRVFGDQQFARMREVELTSDVLSAKVKGITDIASLNNVYREFDDCLPNQEGLEDTFREIMKYIRKELMDTVRSTKFRLQVRTYSLMVSLADSLSGIPEGLGPVELRPGPDICMRMVEVDERLRPAAVPLGLAALKGALTHGTSHVPERRVRNEHFVKMLSLTDQDWNQHWHDLTLVRNATESA